MFKSGYIDIAIGYDNVTPDSLNKNYFKLRKSSGIKKVKVAAIRKKDLKNIKSPIIFTEYPNLSASWCKKNFPNSKVVHVHGGAEQYIANGVADIAIVVVDSGKTLKEYDLEVYDILTTADLSLYYSESTIKKHPNIIRQIKNNMNQEKIYFFDVDDRDNGYLSNFYPAKFTTNENGKKEIWKTSEHYYQANKFPFGSQAYNEVYAAKTAKESYKIAHKYENKEKKNWLKIKDDVMNKALHYKFSQNIDLKNKLLQTKDKILLEHSFDTYWGTGMYEKGQNKLGVLLMNLRSDLGL